VLRSNPYKSKKKKALMEETNKDDQAHPKREKKCPWLRTHHTLQSEKKRRVDSQKTPETQIKAKKKKSWVSVPCYEQEPKKEGKEGD